MNNLELHYNSTSNKTLRIAFTGHRPDKLGGYDFYSVNNSKIMISLSKVVKSLLETGYNNFKFISGGAIGIDHMSVFIVDKLRNNQFKNKDIEIEIAVPFRNQSSNWFNQDDIDRYNAQLKIADKVTYIDTLNDYKVNDCEENIYHIGKLQRRNEYMVDNCDILIAVWNGSKSGTKNCIDYAKKTGKQIIYININDILK